MRWPASLYQAQLTVRGITISMSRARDCYDNALAESFLASLETELIDRSRWPMRRAARKAIFEWIGVFQNPAMAALRPRLSESGRLS